MPGGSGGQRGGRADLERLAAGAADPAGFYPDHPCPGCAPVRAGMFSGDSRTRPGHPLRLVDFAVMRHNKGIRIEEKPESWPLLYPERVLEALP